MRIRAITLFLFMQAASSATANPLAHVPPIPQICRISYGISDGEGVFRRFGICLGTLIGEEGAQSSNQLLTAGHCAPDKIFAAFKDSLGQLPDAIRADWTEHLRTDKPVINLACGTDETQIADFKVQMNPNYSSITLWLWSKMLKEKTGPYPVDLAMIQLSKPVPIQPLAVDDYSVEDIVHGNLDCLITSLSGDLNYIGLRLAEGRLYAEDLIPAVAVHEQSTVIIKPGDSGGPLVCHDGESFKVVGVNSLTFEKLHASFIQNMTPEIRTWISSVQKR